MILAAPAARPAAVPAPAAGPAENPFLRISPMYRVGVLAFFLSYVVLAGFLAIMVDAPASEMYIPALGVLVAVRMLPFIMYKPSYGWYHPLVMVAMLSIIQLSKEFPAYAFGLRYHLALPGLNPHELGALLAWKLTLWSMGLLAYYGGFRYAPRFKVPHLEFPTPTNLRLKVPVVVGFSAVVFAVYLAGKGGLSAHMVSWAQGRRITLAGDFYWIQMANLGSAACLIWLASDRRAFRSLGFWACAVAALSLQFLASGSRSSVIYPMVTAFLVWMLREKKFAPTRALALGVSGVVILGALGNLRVSTWQGSVDWTTLTGSSFSQTGLQATSEIVARRTVADGALPILARVPGTVDHLYGSSYLAVLTLPVPRGLWPGKPGMVGGRVGRTFFGTRAGVPPTAVGEAYWNFNIPGVLFAFAVLGMFHAWVVRWYLAYHDKPVFAVIYVLTLFSVLEPSSEALVSMLMTLIPVLGVAVVFGAIRLDPLRGRVATYSYGSR